ncbi:MAG: hypothetical protein J2P37_00165 [Ktedonobacteraceae bacterium]|nr:hypothetical protein [Ktedonobacteraceae bacterium]
MSQSNVPDTAERLVVAVSTMESLLEEAQAELDHINAHPTYTIEEEQCVLRLQEAISGARVSRPRNRGKA